MAERKSDFLGERYGDWVVMDRADAINRKRRWRVVNSQTDESKVIYQTDLKNLAFEKVEDAVPSSNEITAKVLAGNYADNPFKAPAAAFEPVFREPCVIPVGQGVVLTESGFEIVTEPKVIATVTADGQTDQYLDDGTVIVDWRDAIEAELNGGENPFDVQVSAGFEDTHVADVETAEKMASKIAYDIEIEGAEEFVDTIVLTNQDVSSENGVYQRVSETEPYGFTKEYREAVAMLAEGYAMLRDAISS